MSVGHHAFNFRCIPFRAGWSPHVSRVSLNSHTRLERVDKQNVLTLDTICVGGFEHNPSLETLIWCDKEIRSLHALEILALNRSRGTSYVWLAISAVCLAGLPDGRRSWSNVTLRDRLRKWRSSWNCNVCAKWKEQEMVIHTAICKYH